MSYSSVRKSALGTATPILNGIVLNSDSDTPLHRQLYDQIRYLVLSGTLQGGTLIPSSRILSKSIGVSRFTIVTALDQLVAEGYLSAKQGSGTFVEAIPGRLHLDKDHQSNSFLERNQETTERQVSKKAQALVWRNSAISNSAVRYLHMSAPDHRLFPVTIWSRLVKEVYSRCDIQLSTYRDSFKPTLLEQQIAENIAPSRGINCSPENVVITLGAHHAVNLLSELLLDKGDIVAFEEPGMAAVRSIFASHGCKVVPMFVDKAGANPFLVKEKNVRLAFVTAAKQQPLTIAMPAKRKLEFLHWASDTGAFIIEDDLGSEFRYEGRPIPPLKAMDQTGQVIYVGAFSMTLLQTLRVGYMIMPRDLASKCRRLIQVRYRATPQLTEQVIGRFIEDGHYSRHLHRMRRIYSKRQEHLLQILRNDFADMFEPPKHSAGFYNLCFFKDFVADESAIMQRCAEAGLGVEQLSYYYSQDPPESNALLIGFAASNEEEIERGCSLLRSCL